MSSTPWVTQQERADYYNNLFIKQIEITEMLLEEIENLKADKKALINGQESLQKYIAELKKEIKELKKQQLIKTE